MRYIDVTELIRDYRMMKREIERLQQILYGKCLPMRSWGVAQYGIEAAMPKGSSIRSQEEMKDMDIREQKQVRRLKDYQKKVFALEYIGDFLDKEILKIVYDCMLSGMTRRQIAVHLSLSVDSVDKLRAEVKSQIGTNTTFSNLLHDEKIIC